MNVEGKHYRTIWLPESSPTLVQIIDQRHLPHRFVIEDLTSVDDVARAIKDMHVRGAGLIGATAGFGMYLAALSASRASTPAFLADLKRAGRNKPRAVMLDAAAALIPRRDGDILQCDTKYDSFFRNIGHPNFRGRVGAGLNPLPGKFHIHFGCVPGDFNLLGRFGAASGQNDQYGEKDRKMVFVHNDLVRLLKIYMECLKGLSTEASYTICPLKVQCWRLSRKSDSCVTLYLWSPGWTFGPSQ